MAKRTLIRFLVLGFVILFALPFSWGKLTGLSFWFSPFLMLNSIFVLKSIVLLNFVGFVILVIVWFRKRWFCNYFCPAGLVFDKVPVSKRFKSGLSVSNIAPIGKWLVIISLVGALFGFPFFIFLDPILIFNSFIIVFFTPFHFTMLILFIGLPLLLLLQFVAPGLWCERICPLGGLQLIVYELKDLVKGSSAKSVHFDLGRRVFIGGTIGAFTAVIMPKIADPDSEVVIRPPGSVEKFNTLCIRCGSCIKACPTEILKHNTVIGFGLLTPVIKFNPGYCIETCNSCGTVCTSGSITQFSIEAKKILKIARPVVSLDNCLLMNMKECAICKNACYYGAVSFQAYNDTSLQMKPVIDYSKCNGCGACAVICPEDCIEIKAL